MKTRSILHSSLMVCASVACCRTAGAAHVTFEHDDALAHWHADEGSSRLLSTDTSRSGKRSLAWTWAKERSVLTWTSPGKGVFAQPGSTFTLFVYNLTPIKEQKLQFEIGTAEATQASFDFGLNYKGWRVLHFLYHDDLPTRPDASADTLRIISPASVPEGRLYFDILDTASRYGSQHAGDYQMPWVANVAAGKRVNHWVRNYHNDQLPYPFEPFTADDVTAEMQAALKKLRDHYLLPLKPPAATGISEEQYQGVLRDVATFEIKRRGPFITGRPIWRTANEFLHLVEDPVMVTSRGRGRGGVGVVNTMGHVASLYCAAKDPERKAHLREIFFLLCDYLAEQGWCHGSAGVPEVHHFNAGPLESPIVLMEDELKATGRYEKLVNTSKWYKHFGLARDRAPQGNADQYGGNLTNLCRLAALSGDPVTLANDFRTISRYVGESVFSVSDADGSLYHHNMVHPGYTYSAIQNLAATVNSFSHTPFRVSAKGHARIKKVVSVMTRTAWPATPRSLAHRCIGARPFMAERTTLRMALAGTPDGARRIDPDMAGLYLSVMAAQGKEDEHTRDFRQRGIAPVPLTGHERLANAVFSSHRRDDWQVAIGGMSKYYFGNEFYGWGWTRHCLARHLNTGNIQVLTEREPQLPTDGWDHNHWPGTTAPLLSEAELYTHCAMVRNTSVLAGNSASSRNGVWGMELRLPVQPPEAVIIDDPRVPTLVSKTNPRGYKSAFFFGEHIILLGSGLSSEVEQRLHTTVLQSRLSDGAEPFVVNGQDQLFPSSQAHANSAKYLLGDRRIAYYIPEGNDTLVIRRGEQETLYFLPSEYKPGKDAYMQKVISNKGGPDRSQFDIKDFEVTKGNYNLAYFDHGKNPQGARYEFAMLMNATAESAAAFTENPAYEVLQHDNTAHVVRHNSGDTGYAIFKGDAPLNGGVRSANRPLFILDENGGGVRALYIASSERDRRDPIVLAVEGTFSQVEGGRILAADGATTMIEIPFVHSVVIPVRLNKGETAE